MEFNVNGQGTYFKSSICVVGNYMRNRIIAVYRIANRLVSITVENPDFSELRVNQFVKIGDKEYRINSLPLWIQPHQNLFLKWIHLQLTTQRMN